MFAGWEARAVMTLPTLATTASGNRPLKNQPERAALSRALRGEDFVQRLIGRLGKVFAVED